MENPEEILHSLEEFAKLKPKDIPRELEEYLCFVAKTGDPVYQWSAIKSLFREKLISVITEFYESCPSVDIPPCPNVDLFNYDTMKSFILEKLDTFVAAPFTVQRICELLTTPRKEYNRIDKYMRALEKNILVVSTTEPGNHRTPENGDGFINGIETEHLPEASHEINIEEMDDSPAWPKTESFQSTSKNDMAVDTFTAKPNSSDPETTTPETVITCCPIDKTYGADYILEAPETIVQDESPPETDDVSVTITAIPAPVQKRRDSIEPPNEQEAALEPKPTEPPCETKPEEPATPAGNIKNDVEENKPETTSETSNNTKIDSELGAGDNLIEENFEGEKPLPEVECILELNPSEGEKKKDEEVVEEIPEKVKDLVVEETLKVEEPVDEVVKEEEPSLPEEVPEVKAEEEVKNIEEPVEKEKEQVSLMDVDTEPTTNTSIITTTTTETTNTASADIVQTETTITTTTD